MLSSYHLSKLGMRAPSWNRWHAATRISSVIIGRSRQEYTHELCKTNGKKGSQSVIMGILRAKRVAKDPVPAVVTRLARFSIADPGAKRDRITRVFEIMRKSCVPSTVVVVLRTWMNGWTTTRRFAQPLQKCHLCGGGSDSLEHYLQCPFTIGVWLQRFGQISQKVCIDDVLMLAHGNDGLHNSHIIARCVFLDCLHCAFQVQKSHSYFSMSTVEFTPLYGSRASLGGAKGIHLACANLCQDRILPSGED